MSFAKIGEWTLVATEQLPVLPLQNNNAWIAEEEKLIPAGVAIAFARVATVAGGCEYRPLKRFSNPTEYLGRPLYAKRPTSMNKIMDELAVPECEFDLDAGLVKFPYVAVRGRLRKAATKPVIVEPTPVETTPELPEVKIGTEGIGEGIESLVGAVTENVAAAEPTFVRVNEDGKKAQYAEYDQNVHGDAQQYRKVVNGKKVKYKPVETVTTEPVVTESAPTVEAEIVAEENALEAQNS